MSQERYGPIRRVQWTRVKSGIFMHTIPIEGLKGNCKLYLDTWFNLYVPFGLKGSVTLSSPDIQLNFTVTHHGAGSGDDNNLISYCVPCDRIFRVSNRDSVKGMICLVSR